MKFLPSSLLLLALPLQIKSTSTNTTTTPPNIDSWFLSTPEIQTAMGGTFSRTTELGMSTYTKGNIATPLINGDSYFSSVLADIQKTKEGDYVFFTAWAIQQNMTLDPRGTLAPGVDTRVGSLWRDMIKTKKVKCLTLMWRNVMNLGITTEFHDMMAVGI